MKPLLFSLFVLSIVFGASAQDRPAYFVQFKILKVNSELEAQNIDKKLKSKKGIISTRTDHITSTYFATLSAEAEYDFDQFESWFQKLGYEISCFNRGIHGNGGMRSPHELKNCEENNTNE